MKEFKVLIIVNGASLLYIILQLIIITLFKENWMRVDWNTIVNWCNYAIILDDVGLDVMSPVVVGGILHIFWQDISDSFLIHLIIIKYLNHYNHTLGYLMRVETNFIHFSMFLIVINVAQTYLVIKDVVEDFLQKSKT